MKSSAKLWIGLLILMILTPLGLLAAGTAWGEWGTEEVKGLVGYVPKGLNRLSEIWHAPLPDYTFRGWEEAPFFKSSLAYVVSALVGVTIVVAIAYLLGRFLVSKEEKNKKL
jgi:hypothetical protein